MPFYKTFKNRKGGLDLSFGGHIYTIRREADGITIWRCTKRGCPGSVETNGIDVVAIRDHSHDPEYTKAKCAIIKSEMKDKALSLRRGPMTL